jgi:hypothetical protein
MSKKTLTLCHLYPELLNLYGDSGNMLTLAKRLAWRGLDAQVVEVAMGQTPHFEDVDLVLIGGGSDREQRIVCEELLRHQRALAAYVEAGGVLLAVCGGYQLLGHRYQMGKERLAGLSLVDLETHRGSPRLIGNIAIACDLCDHPVVGYENHGGRTTLGAGVKPLGRVLAGYGNDGSSGFEGCQYKHVVGTYIHGPLLPKNPHLADWLLARACEQAGLDAVLDAGALPPLDDTVELTANERMVERLLAPKERSR